MGCTSDRYKVGALGRPVSPTSMGLSRSVATKRKGSDARPFFVRFIHMAFSLAPALRSSQRQLTLPTHQAALRTRLHLYRVART